MTPAAAGNSNPSLTRFRLRCFTAAEVLLTLWLTVFGGASLLIIPAPTVFQIVSLSTPYVAGAASILVILSGFIAAPYLRGQRPEVTPRRIGLALAMLAGVWGIEVAKDCGATLFTATHARVEIVPDAALSDRSQAPAVVIYGALSRRTPKMLDDIAQQLRDQHPGAAAIKTLFLSSSGGDAKAILNIVRSAEAAGVEQTIAFGDCVSACAAMWLLLPQPQLADDSVVCFHGAHLEESSLAVREIDKALRKAILAKAPADPAAQQHATAALTLLFSHGLWELTCPTPSELAETGLLASVPAAHVPFPEGVARYISANPPGCLARRRMPGMPPAARDPKDDGCRIS